MLLRTGGGLELLPVYVSCWLGVDWPADFTGGTVEKEHARVDMASIPKTPEGEHACVHLTSFPQDVHCQSLQHRLPWTPHWSGFPWNLYRAHLCWIPYWRHLAWIHH